MKNLFSVLLACAVAGLLALTGCGGTPSSSAAVAGLPNPVTAYDTLEEALAAVDFDALVPGYVPEGFAQSAVSTIDGKLVQVTYSNGTETITYRTAPASQGAGDGIGITGDYNQYAATQDLDASGTTLTVKGDKDGEWKVAQWTVGDMMYALAFDPPVSGDEVVKIVESVK